MAAAAAAPPAPTPPRPAPPPIPEQCKHKNRLQQFVQRNYHLLPSYVIETEGQQHELKFRCIVQVKDEQFSSTRSYSCRKDAEQDAARVAYEILIKREKDGSIETSGLIECDVPASGGDHMAATAAPSAPTLPPPIPEQCKHKNRLQEFVQRNYHQLPSYVIETEGQPHELKFRCVVQVEDEQFSSTRSYSCRKDAEQDAARVAYEILVKREEDVSIEVSGLIDQVSVFCKSILHEFAVKTKTAKPSYSVTNAEGSVPMPMFIATVLFDGNTYTGEVAKNKKDAEQKAARAAIKAILARKDTCLLQIIGGKKNHITAFTASGCNKEIAAVSQETHAAPTNNLHLVPAINFVPATNSTTPITYEAYHAPQFANTSGGATQTVPVSQAASSFPIATRGPNIIPGQTQLVSLSQAGSASPIAVPNSIPASTCFAPVSQIGSASSISVGGHSNEPLATPLAPVLNAEPASPITFQGSKIMLQADSSTNPSVQAQTGSKKRKKTRRQAIEERAQKH